MRVLGIETSCDDTSIACVENGHVAACCNAGQEAFHQQYGGVVPEIAARAHLEAIDPLLEMTLTQAGWTLGDIDLIAVTQGPGLLGSLLVGVTTAKTLALLTGKPLIGVNHLLAHTIAPQLATPDDTLPLPLLTLIASGGHTELVLSREPGEWRLLGSTLDDAAGELLDKVGRELGLGFPAGPAIDRLAATGQAERYDLPRPLLHSGDYQFSFSGLKTAALRQFGLIGGPRQPGEQRLMPTAESQLEPADLADACASLQRAVMDVLVAKTLKAAEAFGVAAVAMGGGVAANTELRSRLASGCEELGCSFHAPPLAWCMDNGAMIALAGQQEFERRGPDGLDLDPFASWDWTLAPATAPRASAE